MKSNSFIFEVELGSYSKPISLMYHISPMFEIRFSLKKKCVKRSRFHLKLSCFSRNGTDNDHQSETDDESDDEFNFNQDDEQDTIDPIMRKRLRRYQLNRLKYYYAVVEYDCVETAVRIYEECDGIEYETGAVRLDLRFIPDSMIFNSPHDQCTQLPDKLVYKPIRFRNTALTQTKVRCTWDETPIKRRRLTKKRNYTVEELDQVNLDAYLASESDEEIQNNNDNDNNIESDNDDNILNNERQNDNNVSKAFMKQNQPIVRAPSILSSQDDIDRYR